jgi:hypothetical protein
MRLDIALIAGTALLPRAAAAAATGKKCKDVIDVGPTGMDPADANRVRAIKVSCKVARRVARRYSRWRINDLDFRDPVVHGPWRCYSFGRFELNTVCKRKGGKRVRWRFGP